MLPFWTCSAVTLISAAVSLAFSVVALRGATGALLTSSRYAFSRSIALLVVAVVAVLTGSIGFAAAVAVAMIIVQAVDAWVGAAEHDRMKTWGPVVTAVVNVAALVWMLLS